MSFTYMNIIKLYEYRAKEAARKKKLRLSLKQNNQTLGEYFTKDATRKKIERQNLKQNNEKANEYRIKEASRKTKERQSQEQNNQKLVEYRTKDAARKQKERQSQKQNIRKSDEYRTKEAARKKHERQSRQQNNQKLGEYCTNDAARKREERQNLKQDNQKANEYRTKEAARKREERQNLNQDNQQAHEYRTNEAARKRKDRLRRKQDNQKLNEQNQLHMLEQKRVQKNQINEQVYGSKQVIVAKTGIDESCKKRKLDKALYDEYNLKELSVLCKRIKIDESTSFIKNSNKKRKINDQTTRFEYKKLKLISSCGIFGRIANTDFNEQLITESYLGEMTATCQFCQAKHFMFEADRNGHFNNCCHKGKVDLPDDLPYPNELKELATGTTKNSIEFRKNIRSYNNALAFASFGAHFDRIPGRGPKIIRICGQVYHNVYALHPNQDETRKYGQLYVLDNEMATKERSTSKSESTIDPEMLKQLDKIIRENNPYARAYKMMHEVEQDEMERCAKIGINPRHITMTIKRDENLDKNRYNAATCNEVAMVFVGENGLPPSQRDIVIHSRQQRPVTIPNISKHTDPMTYPLIYPGGGYGWMPKMQCKTGTTHISHLQFYNYRMSCRNGFNPYLNLGKVSQQASVDAFVKVEGSRLYFLKDKQNVLRSECYKGLMDYLQNKEKKDNVKIGKMFILPSTFVGSPRYLKQNYLDAMTLVNHFGKPDLFITMTCNPQWKEITENLEEYETAIDRPDLVAKVFKAKVKELKKLLTEEHCLGVHVAHTSVIEFQKGDYLTCTCYYFWTRITD